ncbi:AI-2E family transporter [Actinoallomurus rhizosphaericola]|uniref:AI-2E family transporter n=1 Tax=Actinoallomurus rhizosphaericola TaxID=2952536 RepID=UPI002090BC3E|nr:AI-2E family transporter [Actinoallomurus rhizosphaericola]MCO5993541.1 AI-2E family transporter [Actinoallomurus rhizosphaericola]
MSDRDPGVPRTLATVASFCWRLIVIGVVIYAVARILDKLRIVVLPCAIALLLCALLYPVTGRLARRMPPLAATWLTMLLALGVLGGVGTFVGIQANDQFPHLVNRIQRTATDVQHWLVTGPLHLKNSQLQSAVDQLLNQIQQQRGKLLSTAFTGATVAGELLAALVFMFFVTFFLLKDGPGIWRWLIGGTGRHRDRIDRAGRAAWETLSQYVHGTVIVALIHAIVIAVTLMIMGVPLVAPLAVIVFFGSFIPIVGILVAGALAVLVVFSFKGFVAALVFLGILILEQQLEGHVLQPLVVGRWVRFHPLAIIIAISVGAVVGGIPGAAVAVPTAAVIYRAWPALRGEDDATSTERPTRAGLLSRWRKDAREGARSGDSPADGRTATAEEEPADPPADRRADGSDGDQGGHGDPRDAQAEDDAQDRSSDAS